MAIVSDITSDLLASIQTTLSTYLPLEYVYNVGLNSFKQSAQRYGAYPLQGYETSGITRHYTVQHRFRVVVTHDWDTSMKTDADRKAKVVALQDACHAIYKDYMNTRNKSLTVQISNMALLQPTFLEDSHVIVQQMEFDLKYHQPL